VNVGGGSSELKAVWAEIRALDARVVACEKDCIRLSRALLKLGPEVTLDDVITPSAMGRAAAVAGGPPPPAVVAAAVGVRRAAISAAAAPRRKR